MARLEQSINPRFKPPLLFIKNGIQLFSDSNLTVYAGHATLFIVTAVFPFIMLIISVVNLLPGYSTKDVADILIQMLPDLGPIRKLMGSIIYNLKDQSGGLLASAAAVTTLWSASRGVSAIQKGLDQLDPKESKSGIKGIIKQLLFTLMLVILIPAVLIFEMLDKIIKKAIHNFFEKINASNLDSIQSKIDSIFSISSLVVLLFALLVILLIYAVLPSVRRTLKSQLPGALCTMVGWFVFTELFTYFVPKFFHSSAIYGSLAALFLALMWLRYMIIILFAGGVLNKTIENKKEQDAIVSNTPAITESEPAKQINDRDSKSDKLTDDQDSQPDQTD